MIAPACTHYPLLQAWLTRLAPWPVAWIDPAPAIAPGLGSHRQALRGERPACARDIHVRACALAGAAKALAQFGIAAICR
jgi:glutamate racemase